MNQQQLFLRTVRDLRNRAESNDAYDVLRSVVLIRQLFLDGVRLVDEVNRDHRVKVTFTILPFKPLPIPMTVHLQPDLLDPKVQASLPNAKWVEVGRDQFFKSAVGTVDGVELSVYDVVMCAANVLGGVHNERAGNKDEAQQALAKINEQLRVGGVMPALRILRAVAGACAKALEPLEAKVSAG